MKKRKRLVCNEKLIDEYLYNLKRTKKRYREHNIISQKFLINHCLIKKALTEPNKEADESYKNLMKEFYIKKYIKKELDKKVVRIDYKVVKYNNKKYLVCKTINRDDKYFIVDFKLKEKIIYLGWKYFDEGYIYLTYYAYPIKKNIHLYQHNYVKNKLEFNGRGKFSTIDHINRVKTDNRLENLRLQSPSEQNNNQGRLKRTVEMPEGSGITVDDVPKYVHLKKTKEGNRFFKVCIKNIPNHGKYESDSTKDANSSLRFKLEQAKKILRNVKQKYPEHFDNLNIEYLYNKESLNLVKSHNDILEKSKYPNIKENSIKIHAKNYLKENLNGLSEKEIIKLSNYDPDQELKQKKDNSLPSDCGVKEEDLPQYVRYYSETNKRGAYFKIVNHPNQSKIWYSYSRRSLAIEEKLRQTLDRLEELNNIRINTT